MIGMIQKCLTYASFILIFGIAISTDGFAQKRSDRSKTDTKPSKNDSVGPKRTDRTVPESERVKVITKTEFVRVAVNPDKGYLSLVAIPKADVTLTPLPPSHKNAVEIKETIKDPDGSLNLINLLPGKYKLTIEHEDYSPLSDTIQVDPARPDTYVAMNKMVSLYGVIRIGGIMPGSKVFLDDQPVKPSDLVLENQNASIAKVPVGKHRLRISKDGYVDLNKEIEVLPGKQSFVPAQLELAMVTISLISQPGARVYAGSAEKAIIPSDGKVAISLPPGRHSIRVSKEGYQEWTKEFSLSLATNSVAERIELIPVPNSAEGNWNPLIGARNWNPPNSGWQFDKTGALIRGDKLVLFDTETHRDFNTYRDFKLAFDVVFKNGKSVSWVARAKDPSNYYLFEIANPLSSPTFNFYICQDGKLELKGSQPIVENMSKSGDSFFIEFQAQGNRFDTRMTIASAASAQPHLIGIFQDNSFSYGGIGFRGKDTSESLLQSFIVTPLQ